MGLSRYESLVRQLYQLNLTCQAKLGLENITRLHAALGEPLKSVPNIIHVGGTNGKGSVAFKIARSMQYSGLRTGLFVSPHISSFRERMQVNGALISEQEVVEMLSHILAVRESKDIQATFFEVTTALAFQFFATQNLDAAVVEVGLGGRLDATNILTPRLSIITSIGLDHVKILGSTVEEVAREKAGIMKKGVPVVLGPNTPRPSLQELAARAGSPVIMAPSGPFANFEEENTAMARTAIEELQRSSSNKSSSSPSSLSPPPPPQEGPTSSTANLPLAFTEEGLARGLASRPPARFEVLKRRVATAPGGALRDVDVVMDVGHNKPAVTRLFEWLARHFAGKRRFRVVLGLSSDKDVEECLEMVLQVVSPDRLHLVEAAHPRAMPGKELAMVASRLGHTVPRDQCAYASVGDGVRAALQKAATAAEMGKDEEEAVVVCGTFFIMGEARQALGFDEPIDSKAVAEVAGAHFRSLQEVFSQSQP